MRDAAAIRDVARDPNASDLATPPSRTIGRFGPEAIHSLLLIYDAVVAVVALLLSHRAQAGWLPETVSDVIAIVIVAPAVWLSIFVFFRAYPMGNTTPGEEIRRTLGATATGSLGLAGVASWRGLPLTMSVLAWLFVLAVTSELLGRWVARSLAARTRRAGVVAVRTVVVGTNHEAQQLASTLSSSTRFDPVGFIGQWTDDPLDGGLPVVGGVDETEDVLRAHGVRSVYVASSALAPQQIEAVARACRRANAELHISTNVTGIHPSRLVVRSTDGLTALSVRPVRLSGHQAAIKRAFDIVVGSAALLVALPFIAVVAGAIRFTSPGPAFYRQTRITKDGRPFTMYKFRSMVVDPERALEGKVIDLTKPFFKLEDDPRLTRIGRVIRSISIDEVPQLWNIVRGDMSLIGPRPLPAEQVAANAEFLAPRHEVRGGLTGLWQVSGRSELDSEEALRIDRFYIENWSLGLDLWILFRTFGAVLARRGAV